MGPTCATLAMHLVWSASFADIYLPGIWGWHRTSSAVPCTCVTHCTLSSSFKQHSRNDKKKDSHDQMSVYQKADRSRWAHSVSHTRVTVERGIKFGIDQNRDAAANCWRLAPVTHAGRAASSPEIFRPFLAVCLTVFPFEFWPRTFTIGFYGKKSFISELMILECSSPPPPPPPLPNVCLPKSLERDRCSSHNKLMITVSFKFWAEMVFIRTLRLPVSKRRKPSWFELEAFNQQCTVQWTMCFIETFDTHTHSLSLSLSSFRSPLSPSPCGCWLWSKWQSSVIFSTSASL